VNPRVAASAAVVPLAVLIHAPSTVYFANRGELAGSPASVLWPFLVAFLAATALLWLALGRMTPESRARGQWWLFLLAILAAVQSTFLVHDYGALEGTGLVFAPPSRAMMDVAILAGLAFLLVRLRPRLSQHVDFATVALVGWLAGASLLMALPPRDAPKATSVPYEDRFAALTEASTSMNVFHIMLDSFQRDVWSSIVETDPRLRSRLDGFTLFPDQAAYGNFTFLNFPPMWSGEALFDRPKEVDALARTRELVNPGLPRILSDSGVRVSLVTPFPFLCVEGVANCITLPEDIAWHMRTRRAGLLSVSSDSLFVADLALFRLAPTPLKNLVYQDGRWTISRLATSGRGSLDETLEMNVMERQIPRSLEFFRSYTQALHAGSTRPAYHFIHVFPPHQPFVLDAECRPRLLTVPERRVQGQYRERPAYEAQARCAWRAADEFLERLRSIGLYDRSAILIESDHGLGVLASRSVEAREPLLGMPMDRVRVYANPLLLVKPPGARGPLRRSSAPTSHFESAPTVLRWLGIDHPLARRPGYLEVTEGERRPRTFVLSGRPQGSEGPPFHLLQIEGPVDEPESWRSLGVFRRFGRLYSDPSGLPLPGFTYN
jgi:hypothetical protein